MKNTLSSYKLIYLWSIFNSICVAIFLQLSLCTLCTILPMNQHKYLICKSLISEKNIKLAAKKLATIKLAGVQDFFLKKSFKEETVGSILLSSLQVQ